MTILLYRTWDRAHLFFQIGLRVAALGNPGQARELAVGAIFDHHISAALLADHIGDLVLDLHLLQLSCPRPGSTVLPRSG